ncbi:DUF6615 family protein [Hyphomonas sp.]|uniref:DUF6615 family protein n=1 Tax=Hyphomonas sp. TaxID=87 RepID=UPI0032EBE5AA
MAKDICWVFRLMAGIIYSETHHALKHSRFSLQEETITEMLLLRLSRRFVDTIFDFRAFTKSEEGLVSKNNPYPTGADFEFWFTDYLGNQIKLRAQAKRQFPSGKYEGLNPSSKQIQYLLKHSADALPIYLFYNVKGMYDYSSAITYPSGRNFASPSYWGCAYALASDVLSLGKNPGPGDLLPARMWPWHTLVCDHPSITSLPERVGEALDERKRPRLYDRIQMPGIIDTAPLESLAPEILRNQELPDWFNAESWRDPRVSNYLESRDLGGVVILNQRIGQL